MGFYDQNVQFSGCNKPSIQFNYNWYYISKDTKVKASDLNIYTVLEFSLWINIQGQNQTNQTLPNLT